MNKFYVYVHRRKSDNKPFYVGKGCGKRAWRQDGRNEHWDRTFIKHGLTVEIVFDNLDEQTAFQVEKDTILEFKYFGYPLTNKTDGGEGVSGSVCSEEHRRKLALVHKGKPKKPEAIAKTAAAHKGKTVSDLTKQRISLAKTGLKQSEETKQKRANTLKEVGTCNDRFIYCFYSNEDVFIGTRKEFSKYSGIAPRQFRTLFSAQRSKVVKGWSLLTMQTLSILKEIQNDHRN